MNPCHTLRCTYCCEHTNMLLTAEDVSRLETLGFKKESFSKPSALGTQLKNTHGHCVFLTAGHCTIYDHRPDGCRLYPIVYDKISKDAIQDNACPRFPDFPVTPETRRKLKDLIQRLFPEGF